MTWFSINKSTPRAQLWPQLLLPALTLTFGLQIIRTLIPYLQYLLGDRLGFEAIQLGLVALGVFAATFLVGPVNRLLGEAKLLLISAGGLALTRLAIQLWQGDPLVDLTLAALGTICFLWFWPVYLGHIQGLENERSLAAQQLAVALLLGLAIDTALQGAFLSYDFIWQRGFIPIAVALALVAIQVGTLWLMLPAMSASSFEGKFWFTLPWLAFGPFLFLQVLIFQNLARLTALTGWSFSLVFIVVLGGQLIGLWLAEVAQVRGYIITIILSFILISSILFAMEPGAALDIVLRLVAGQLVLALLLPVIIRGLVGGERMNGLKRSVIIHGLGMILFVTLIFAFYIRYSLPAPYPGQSPIGVAGVIIVACALIALRRQPQIERLPIQAAKAAAPLIVIPLVSFFFWPAPQSNTPTAGAVGDLRVVNYNLHNGFNTQGHLDLEAQAQVIESRQPDIVTLQEVSRGWLINGSVDMASWLSQRLDMPYRFTPAADALWGQAVLSRYPILAAETHPLPPRDLPLKRSFGYLEIDVGWDEPLRLINTHYHHVGSDSDIRVQQSNAVLNFLAGRHSDVLLMTGDLNAEPGAREIKLLLDYGLTDVIAETGLSPGYTFHAEAPFVQIDYILVSPDLNIIEADIPASTASDHLGIETLIDGDYLQLE